MNNLWMKPQWLYHINKKPMNPNADYRASGDPTDPAKWSTADVAQAACERFGGTGLGIAFGDGLAGIDIDAHGIPKNPLQDEILDMFAGTYIECSPSGKGRHILFYVDYGILNDRGYINDELEFVGYANKKRSIDVETYIAKRYFTWTGTADEEHFTTYDVNDMTEQYMAFLDKYMLDEKPTYQAPTQQHHVELDMTTAEILDRARTHANGDKFIALYDNGDLSAYNNDHSAADLALCDKLAWWLGKDAAKIDAAFQDSALMRDKWLERHGKQTYGEMTIAAAIRDTQGQYDPFGDERGATMHTNAENPVETLSEPQTGDIFDLNVFRYELAQRNIEVRLDCISQEVSFVGLPEHIESTKAVPSIVAELYGPLRKKYKGVSTKLMTFFIEALAADTRNQFNPVLDYFEGKKWDGTDHLGRLYETLGIEDDELSKTLVRKWFMQGWILLNNDPKKPVRPEGVLVLSGNQGCGKTSFFSIMSIDPSRFFREGQSITGDKDTKRRAVTAWITELGEIGCTFKHDMDSLKAFITDPEDTYRNHYAPTDTKELRRTNLGATVNGSQYLIDTTGNRRFWTVPLTHVDVTALRKFNATQLWLQIWEDNDMEHMTHDELGACYRLTAEQSKALNTRNGFCEKPLKFEDEVRDILAEIEDDPRHYVKRATCKQFIEAHSVLFHATAQQVSAVFDRLGVAPQLNDGKLMTVDGKRGRYREIPWV